MRGSRGKKREEKRAAITAGIQAVNSFSLSGGWLYIGI